MRLTLSPNLALLHLHPLHARLPRTCCIAQDKKRAVVDAALAGGGEVSAAANRLTMDDLRFLFGGG